jgi:hypothetical protein
MKPSPRAAIELAVWYLHGKYLPEPANWVMRILADTASKEDLIKSHNGFWRADFARLHAISPGIRTQLINLGFTATRSLLLSNEINVSEYEDILPVLARAFEQSRLHHYPIIKRRMLRANPDVLFVFGDNLQGAGFGGQAAEMRGEPNAVGIPTKRAPRMTPDAFFSDHDLPEVLQAFEEPFRRLRAHLEGGKDVIMPEAGIGTGFARLEQKAPTIHEALERHLRELDMMAMSPFMRNVIDRKAAHTMSTPSSREDAWRFDGP